MKLTGKLASKAGRRLLAASAIGSAAILLPAAALASPLVSSAHTTATTSAVSASPRCVRSSLTAWLGIPGDGTAGSTYYELEISNVSGHSCTLYGYPGVSALGGGSVQLGSAAVRSPGDPERTVTLAPDGTAHAILRIADVDNYPASACHPATAYSLRVYAPGDYASIRFPFSFRACARKGPAFLNISPVLAGTGIPGHSN